MNKLLQNKYFWIAVVIAILIVLFFGYGSYQHKEGLKEGKLSVNTNILLQKTTTDSTAVNYYRNLYLKTKQENKDKDDKYNFMLSIHQSFQKKAEQQKQYYTSIITKLSDSLKNKKIDSIQKVDNTGLLTDYLNYPILKAQYDTCKATNTILEHKVVNDSLQAIICDRLTAKQDSLITDYKDKVELLQKTQQLEKRKKNFWLFVGWGVAFTETALAVKYFLFPNK